MSPACNTFQIARKRYVTVSLSSCELVFLSVFSFIYRSNLILIYALILPRISGIQVFRCSGTNHNFLHLPTRVLYGNDRNHREIYPSSRCIFSFLFLSYTLHCTIKTEFLICMNKHTDNIWIVFQNIICTSSNDYAGFFLSQIFDDLCLIVEDIFF